jgi:hypothetical protein
MTEQSLIRARHDTTKLQQDPNQMLDCHTQTRHNSSHSHAIRFMFSAAFYTLDTSAVRIPLDNRSNRRRLSPSLCFWIDREGCLQDLQVCYTSIVHIHTLPDPTPIATIVPRTDEHDGRYSAGIQSMFSLACLIHVLSELRLVPRY